MIENETQIPERRVQKWLTDLYENKTNPFIKTDFIWKNPKVKRKYNSFHIKNKNSNNSVNYLRSHAEWVLLVWFVWLDWLIGSIGSVGFIGFMCFIGLMRPIGSAGPIGEIV